MFYSKGSVSIAFKTVAFSMWVFLITFCYLFPSIDLIQTRKFPYKTA